jgi:hypothetical protein
MGQSLLLVAKDFIASNFATIVAGGFGAFFGAVGAQFIISRGQNRQAVVGELNNINAAVSLCTAVCNGFLGLKRQHAAAIGTRFEADLEAHRRGQVVQFDLQTLSPVHSPIEQLERLAYEKISIRGRGIAAAVELGAAIRYLSISIAYRNELIEEFRKEPLSEQEKINRYFGLQVQRVADQRFASNVKAICAQTDDGIFFSRILADDLVSYGARLRKRHRRKYLKPLPKIGAVDWSYAENLGLMPPRKAYKVWLRRFKDDPQPAGFRKVLQWISGWFGANRPKTEDMGKLRGKA